MMTSPLINIQNSIKKEKGKSTPDYPQFNINKTNSFKLPQEIYFGYGRLFYQYVHQLLLNNHSDNSQQ